MNTRRALVDGRTFEEAMARLAAPVTVVTTVGPGGRPHGLTVSGVSSVSVEPPLVLVSVSRTAPCRPVLAAAGEFVVNVLARRSAGPGVDRFADGGFTRWPGLDLPCLPDADVLLRCANSDVLTAGDHDLLVGAVLDVHVAGEPVRAWATEPLVPALPVLATLSAREDEIALLVGQGLTNQQVALRLGLSPHTVNFHLRNIFRKLSISTRVALARVMAQSVTSAVP